MTFLSWLEKLDIVFCLIWFIVSPEPPPLAAAGLLAEIELNTYWAVVVFKFWFTNLICDVSIFVIEFADELDATPPPVLYLTVKVVFDGAIP